MNPLKGLGAVASISGWKAQVRKAAKELGEEELVSLNAGKNAGIKLNRKARYPSAAGGPKPSASLQVSETGDTSAADGISRRRIWAEGGTTKDSTWQSFRVTVSHTLR